MAIELINPEEPPSVFMHIETGGYPVFDQNIRDLYPEIELPVPLTAESVVQLGYVPVYRTVRQQDCCSFVWRRLDPGYDESIGYYENWTYEPSPGSVNYLNRPNEGAIWDIETNTWNEQVLE